MSLLDAPLWLQVALGLNALVVAGLVARRGWHGLGWSIGGSVAFWLILGLGASMLVSRMEGGRPGLLTDLVPGAFLALLRLAAIAWPLVLAAAAAGAMVRWVSRRRPP